MRKIFLVCALAIAIVSCKKDRCEPSNQTATIEVIKKASTAVITSQGAEYSITVDVTANNGDVYIGNGATKIVESLKNTAGFVFAFQNSQHTGDNDLLWGMQLEGNPGFTTNATPYNAECYIIKSGETKSFTISATLSLLLQGKYRFGLIQARTFTDPLNPVNPKTWYLSPNHKYWTDYLII